MRHASCPSLLCPIVAALTVVLPAFWGTAPSQAQAVLLPLQITVIDPSGDNTGPIDVRELTLQFDDGSGAYEIRLRASDSAPFFGDFRVNVNLFNVDANSFLQDVVNDYSLSTPTTTLNLTGNSAQLTSWSAGDRVFTNSLFGTPNPPGSSLYRASVISVPFSFLTNEDYVAFADPAMPAIVSFRQSNATRSTDFDGDAKADVTIYRPSGGVWYVLRSSSNFTTFGAYGWGVSTDVPVAGDFDGDGKADVSVFRPSTGIWYILFSGTNFSTSTSHQWGVSTDTPVPGDYDGDGRTDVAVYRSSTGVWYIRLSSTNYSTFASYQWGVSTDVPVPGDYDGDGKTDVAIYRPATGVWYTLLSSTNFSTYTSRAWGISTDTPVPGDYDGDGKIDVAIYRPSTGTWYILWSSTNFTTQVSHQWGVSTDIPVPSDYDGDGKADVAIYRPSSGTWYIRLSTTNSTTYVSYQWGVGADIPLPKKP